MSNPVHFLEILSRHREYAKRRDKSILSTSHNISNGHLSIFIRPSSFSASSSSVPLVVSDQNSFCSSLYYSLIIDYSFQLSASTHVLFGRLPESDKYCQFNKQEENVERMCWKILPEKCLIIVNKNLDVRKTSGTRKDVQSIILTEGVIVAHLMNSKTIQCDATSFFFFIH